MAQRDPFSWAENYARTQHTRAAQESGDAQNALMNMFTQEAARQKPYNDLPVDLAKQNNAYNNQIQMQQYNTQMKAFDAPTDVMGFSTNLIERLSKDLNISVEAASGIVGNLASETGDFKHLQELNPVVPGSRGGAGWAMWTGPRRKDFEAFTGGDTTNPEANYAYLVHDLKDNYPQVLAQLQQTNNPLAAAKIIHDKFLIPGVPHLRKSAVRSQQFYEAFNTGKAKQIAGDAEYDRRSARSGPTVGQQANQAFGQEIAVNFNNVDEE